MRVAQDRQQRYANKRRRDVTFSLGDSVLLSTTNLRNAPGKARKFLPRYVGPFKVTGKLGEAAYRLELPPTMSRLHPVFHVSLLKKYTGSQGFHPPPVMEWLEDAPHYEVHSLLNHGQVRFKKRMEYLVKWTGYDDTYNTWEPEAMLAGAPQILSSTPPPPRFRITTLAANPGSHADLLVFAGTYKGHSVRVLIDGGATGSFIDSAFCAKFDIQTAQKVSPHYISLADGHQQPSNAMIPNARFRLGTYKGEQTLHVTQLHEFDIILGKPWLAEINPRIDWKANIMRFPHAGRQHTLRPPVKQPGTSDTANNPLLISSAQLRTAVSDKCPVFLVSITPADSKAETSHQVLDCAPIVQEYADVFPADLPRCNVQPYKGDAGPFEPCVTLSRPRGHRSAGTERVGHKASP
ncbi:hypothetical protein QJQ45_005823 [Haematococcus lacustris]|nr:hypothetical protein QJQ45_005823 [Haematococcus lacustris]